MLVQHLLTPGTGVRDEAACHVAGEVPVACNDNKFVVLSASKILRECFSNITALTGQDPFGNLVYVLPNDRISPAGIKKNHTIP